jgi:hypothetical protein
MARFALACAVVWMLVGCGGGRRGLQHPLTNELDPDYNTHDIRTLAALPFESDISEDEDPDLIAASMVANKFYVELDRNSGFTILPSSEVERILEQAGMNDALKGFYKDWVADQWDIDEDFIKAVADELKVDGVVAGAVDVWYQREVDITEAGTARTAVGVIIGMFDAPTGKRLWLGRDENFQDGVRYPGMSTMSTGQLQRDLERTNKRTAAGAYAPPDYVVVVDLVVHALVQAFPAATP